MIYLIALLPLLAFYRFRHTNLDRDFTPYAAPAVFKIGYLEQGHHDIKPPLIHWSYKAWLGCVSWLKLPLPIALRLLQYASVSMACLLVSQSQTNMDHPILGALVLALLLTSPTLWTHMANTEWLTVLFLSLTVSFSNLQGFETYAWLTLGLLPFINQKNALLLVPVMWALGLSPTPTNLAALCIPGMLILSYLSLTGRFKTFLFHVWTMPNRMGKSRTLKQNTLGHLHLLKPGILLMMPFVASLNVASPWALVLVLCILVSLWSKQIVPHHFILWAFPLAMACEPTVMTFVAFAIVWAFRDLAIWIRPANIYPITFGAPNGDYGMRLDDGEWVARWLEQHKAKELWVNGMDNNVYLQANIKPWNLVVPEWTEKFEGLPPKHIVHCPGAIEFDYDKHGYEMKESSPRNSYIIMERA